MKEHKMSQFFASLSQHYDTLEVPEGSFRSQAWHAFADKLPSLKFSESYKHLPLSKLHEQSFSFDDTVASLSPRDIEKWVFPECIYSHLVFIDGHYAPHLSSLDALNDLITIEPLPSEDKYSGDDIFSACNAALHREALHITIPAHSRLSSPLQLLHLFTDEERYVMPRIHLSCGESSKAILVASCGGTASRSFFNGSISIDLAPHASLAYNDTAFLSDDMWYFSSVDVTLAHHAHFYSVDATNGCQALRRSYNVSFTEEHATARLHGMWSLQNSNHAHTSVRVNHHAANCSSRQLFKGILDDTSLSSFSGHIYIPSHAQKSDAEQLNKNLLLSDDATAKTAPALEVYADDVKASHGATIGHLDEDQLFYLQSRGLSSQQAQHLLTQGFIKEIVDLFSVEDLAYKFSGSTSCLSCNICKRRGC
jgi:Fe-S cluster assembly protein SufD